MHLVSGVDWLSLSWMQSQACWGLSLESLRAWTRSSSRVRYRISEMPSFYGNRLIILIMEEDADTKDLLRPLTPIQLKIDYTLVQTVLTNRMARLAQWIQRVELELSGFKEEGIKELSQRIVNFEKKIETVLNPAQLRKLRAANNKEVKQLDETVMPKAVGKDSEAQQTDDPGVISALEDELIQPDDPNIARIAKLQQQIESINRMLSTFKKNAGPKLRPDLNKTMSNPNRHYGDSNQEGKRSSFNNDIQLQDRLLERFSTEQMGVARASRDSWESVQGCQFSQTDEGTNTNRLPEKQNKSIETNHAQKRVSKLKQKKENPNTTITKDKINQNVDSCLKRLEQFTERQEVLEKEVFRIRKTLAESVSKTVEERQEQLQLTLRQFSKANNIIAEHTNSNTEKINVLETQFQSIPKMILESQDKLQQDLQIKIDQAKRAAEEDTAALHESFKESMLELKAKLDRYIQSEENSLAGDPPAGQSGPVSQQHYTARNIRQEDQFSSTTARYRKGDNKAFELNCKVEVLEHHVKTMAEQVKGCKEEIDKNKKKDKINPNSTLNNSKGFLPKIQKVESVRNLQHETHPAADPMAELRRINERITLSEQTLKGYKTKLRRFEEMYSDTPSKILEMERKLDNQTQIRQQRLLQLIKDLINRCLTDPFNNQFTNVLKKEIHVKFLEIRHEYYGILKEIEKKVENRADQKELNYLKEKLQGELIETKTLLSKKCDSEQVRKSVRFLQAKIKELHLMIKNSEQIEDEMRKEHSLSIYTRR